MVQRIKDAKPRLTRDSQNLQHMRYAIISSATPFMRSHILPPSEMKSLYGSMTSSAVIFIEL